MQSQSQWYLNLQATPGSDPAEEAFQEAVLVFQLDPHVQSKFSSVRRLRSLNDLEAILNEARSKYERQHRDSRAGKWLSKLSARISHYGRVLDVLVQHHPEYVSLAWGAMKFLFIVSRIDQTFVRYADRLC